MNNRPPMKTWKVALLTLLALSVLFAVAIPVFSKNIESSIARNIEEALRKGEADWASFVVDGRDVSITGVAPNEAEKARIEELVAAVDGVRVVDDRLSVAEGAVPYAFLADFNGETVRLSGFADTPGDKRIVLREARDAFKGFDLVDEVKVLAGAPDDWLVSVTTALQQLARLEQGKLAVNDYAVRLEGSAPNATEAESARNALALLGKNQYSVNFEVSVSETTPSEEANSGEPLPSEPSHDAVAEAAATVDGFPVEASLHCQAVFDELLAKDRIRFATGKTRISRRSYPLLRQLREAVSQCPGVTIEVAGYTDSQGGAKRNQELSEARAEAVVQWLVKQGVDAGRLQASGYGETNPVASNRTRAGRALNRRIEFKVKGE